MDPPVSDESIELYARECRSGTRRAIHGLRGRELKLAITSWLVGHPHAVRIYVYVHEADAVLRALRAVGEGVVDAEIGLLTGPNVNCRVGVKTGADGEPGVAFRKCTKDGRGLGRSYLFNTREDLDALRRACSWLLAEAGQ